MCKKREKRVCNKVISVSLKRGVIHMQPRIKGTLVIIRAKNCHVCLELDKANIFTQIKNNINLGGGEPPIDLDMNQMGFVVDNDTRKPIAVFNLVGSFPRFIYMLEGDTFDRALISDTNYKSVVNEMRFFGYQWDDAANRMIRVHDNMCSLQEIQKFCDTSMFELLQAKTGSAPLSSPPPA